MKYYELTKDLYFKNGITLCLGMFDGMHLGHQKIIETAKNLGLEIAILEFEEMVISHFKNGLCLNSYEERRILHEMFEIDLSISCDFLHDLKDLTPSQFVKSVLKRLNVKHAVVGEDFRFGKDASGNVTDLVRICGEFGIKVVEVPLLFKSGTKISTSHIIKLIQNGEIKAANSLLGFNYFIAGKVVKGQEVGRDLGFRTANIEFKHHHVIPRLGVYYATITVDGLNYHSMVNIGVHPTVNSLKMPIVEAHLFNFNENIYGKEIIIRFNEFIRKEQEFASTDELIEQLNNDKNEILCLMLKK